MMAVYAPDAKPVPEAEALKSLETYRGRYGTSVKVKDFMAFSINYYGQMVDASTGEGLAELLVDRYTGAVYPEPGPNMIAVAGTILSTGEVRNAYNFTTCTWDAINRYYRIELAGIADATTGYVALVTPFSSTSIPNLAASVNFSAGSPNDVLIVYITNTAGALQQCGFHFVVFKTS